MKNAVKRIYRLIGALALASSVVLFQGCGNKAAPESVRSAMGLRYDELPLSAELIRIGTVAYTKGNLEDEFSLLVALRKIQDPKFSDDKIPSMRYRMIPTLYLNAQRALLYKVDSQSIGAKPSAGDIEEALKTFVKTSGFRQESVEELKRELKPAEAKTLDALAESDAIMQAYLAKKRDGKSFEPTEEDLRRAKDGMDKVVALTAEETKKSWATAKDICRRLDAGENFADLADKHSIAKEFDAVSNGDWYATSLNVILDDKLRVAVAETPVGGHTPPIETNEGIYIVKVMSRVGKGEISMMNQNPEKLRLKRIVVRLPKAATPYERNLVSREIARVRNAKFQADLLKELSDKFNMTYPSGTNLWSRANGQNSAK